MFQFAWFGNKVLVDGSIESQLGLCRFSVVLIRPNSSSNIRKVPWHLADSLNVTHTYVTYT